MKERLSTFKRCKCRTGKKMVFNKEEGKVKTLPGAFLSPLVLQIFLQFGAADLCFVVLCHQFSISPNPVTFQ